MDTYDRHVESEEVFVQQVARIFTFLKDKLEEANHGEKMETDEDESTNAFSEEMDLTFLAHGHIRCPKRPCKLYYMNKYVKSVTLYVPWGCGLHATAAWGIATETITRENVTYSPDKIFHTPRSVVLPDPPDEWNKLPCNDRTLIPDVVFTPITTNEDVFKALQYISEKCKNDISGLVVPYFQQPGTLGLPEVQLWALCSTVSATAWALSNKDRKPDVKYRIRIASCLYPSPFPNYPNDANPDDVIQAELWRYPNVTDLLTCETLHRQNVKVLTINCENYGVVPVLPRTTMAMNLFDTYNIAVTDPELQRHINTVNAALGVEASCAHDSHEKFKGFWLVTFIVLFVAFLYSFFSS